MTLVAPTLSRLCGDVDEFVRRHWERAPHLHHGEGFGDLFSLATADQLLGAGALQVPSYVGLSRVAPTISAWEHRCRRLESPLGQPTLVIDPAAAIREFNAGRTIVFHSLRDRVPELDQLAYDLEAEIGHRVSADAFVTPPHQQCGDPHYDISDLFVLAIQGTMEWSLWEPTVTAPLPTHCPDQTLTTGDPTQVSLVPGDVLYVPRGHPHAGMSSSTASILVTLSVNVTTWRDLLRRLLGPLAHHPCLRAALPVGYLDDPSLLVEPTQATLDQLAALLAAVDPSAAAQREAARFTPQRGTSAGALAAAVAGTAR